MDIIQNFSFVVGFIVLIVGIVAFIRTAFVRNRAWGWAVMLSAGVLWPVHLMREWQSTYLWFLFIAVGIALLRFNGFLM